MTDLLKVAPAPDLEAAELERIVERLCCLAATRSNPVAPPPPKEMPVGLARRISQSRQFRAAVFPGLVADPAWDILLDLYAAEEEGLHISVSSACVAAAVPSTTALRWLRILCERGLITRRADSFDGRRVFVSLSEEGRAATGRCLVRIEEIMDGYRPAAARQLNA